MAARLAALMLAVCTTIAATILGGTAAFAAPQELESPPAPTPESAADAAPETAPQEVPDYQIPPNGYNPPSSMAQELQEMAAAHSAMSLVEIGRSAAGEPLLMASFAGPRFAYNATPGIPAILVVANLEGDRLAASEVAMGLCRHLASGEATILQRARVFVMPMANPDATAHAFAGLAPWRGTPTDNDRDGRVDEDGMQDLDGDGRLLWMRLPQPDGKWLADEMDPRVSREADASASEAGVFHLLREGIDADGDHEHLEDGPGGVAVEANFPHRWIQYAPNAGRFQLSESESRALVDFVLMHSSIALAVVLDDEDNLAKPGKGIDRSDAQSTDSLKDDAALLQLLGTRLYEAEEIKAPRSAEHGKGNFADWLYFQRGILVLESALWSPPLDVKAPQPEEEGENSEGDKAVKKEDAPKGDSDEHKLLLWADSWYRGAAFQPFAPLQHAQLGAIEIGGWMPLVLNNPPADLLPELTANFTTFLDSLGEDLPQLRWSVEVTALDDAGVYEARAFLVCDGLLPTMTAMGRATRQQMPLRITLELPAQGELLVGRQVQSVERLDGLGGNSEFSWIYRIPQGADPPRIRARSKTAGEALINLEVN